MTRSLLYVLFVFAALGLGCGGDDDPSGPNGNGGGNEFRATVDGSSWSAISSTIQVTGGTEPSLGTIVISGADASGHALLLTLSFVSTNPQSYPLGVNPASNAGGSGSVVQAPNTWLTPLNGDAGTVEITVRTATRIAGTFDFTAAPFSGGGSGDIDVTGGEFDITIENGLPALPTGGGNLMTATLDGEAWNGATITQVSNGSSFGGMTTEFSINLVGAVAPGSFDLGVGVGQWQCLIQRTGTADSWATTSSDSVGSIIFLTVLPDRMQGIFSGTIPPQGAADSLTVTDGFFSISLE